MLLFGFQRRSGPDKAPKKGDRAPDFKLLLLETKQPKKDSKDLVDPRPQSQKNVEGRDSKTKSPVYIKLSDFKGKKDVVLIFGSYT